jgi:hypothetical protein
MIWLLKLLLIMIVFVFVIVVWLVTSGPIGPADRSYNSRATPLLDLPRNKNGTTEELIIHSMNRAGDDRYNSFSMVTNTVRSYTGAIIGRSTMIVIAVEINTILIYQ